MVVVELQDGNHAIFTFELTSQGMMTFRRKFSSGGAQSTQILDIRTRSVEKIVQNTLAIENPL